MLLAPFVLLLAAPPLAEETFVLETPAQVSAVLTATCPGCDWGRRGQEAVALELRLDDRYSQHVLLTRAGPHADYAVALGRVEAGSHRLTVTVDRARSAPRAGDATLERVAVTAAPPGSSEETLLAHAPVLTARPRSVARFSDVPLLLWVETDRLPDGGTRLRYSVVFSNEDGGTPPDRLMATWGRLTDIEFVYGVERDREGRPGAEQFQGPEHTMFPFAGVHEGARPVLYVVTDNNMVSDHGAPTVRFAPAPLAFDLSGRSREAVMDAYPWAYAVSIREARREGRVKARARPGSRKLPDPRHFATLEACADTSNATLAFALGVRGPDGRTQFFDSDGGLPRFRIARRATEFPNGCFRGSVALPPGTRASDVETLRMSAFTRLPGKGEAPLPPGSGRARLLRVNTLFLMGSDDLPGPGFFSWEGDATLTAEGPPLEMTVRADASAGPHR